MQERVYTWKQDPIVAPENSRNTSVLFVIYKDERPHYSKTVYKYFQSPRRRNPNRRIEKPYFKGRVFLAELSTAMRCGILNRRTRKP